MATKTNRVEGGEASADELVNDVGLGSRDQRLMERVMRFLMAMQTPRRAVRAQREGYTQAEHEIGWKLWRQAAGEGRALDEFFAEVRSGDQNPEQLRILRELDSFENTWFPRVRAIIRRVVPAVSRGEFEEAFFKDLSQQPLGPAVVGSVSALLGRIEGLAHSEHPHAAAVAGILSARGLSAAKIAQVRELIASLESRLSPGIKIDAALIRQAQEAQQAAFIQLRHWFHDWAVTLRSVFPVSEQIRMGLTVARRDAPDDDDDDDDAVTGTDDAVVTPPAPGSARVST
jgi:hypothetical protein